MADAVASPESPDDEGSGSPPAGRRFVLVLIAALLVALVGGLATVGLGDDPPNTRPRAEGPRGACEAHELRYSVTDDGAEYDRLVAFDQGSPDVVPPGFHEQPMDPIVSLHGAAHGYVVVFYRPDLPESVVGGLRALQAAGDDDAPVLVVPREQTYAISAVGSNWGLRCPDGDEDAVLQTVRFAAETSPMLAKAAAVPTP